MTHRNRFDTSGTQVTHEVPSVMGILNVTPDSFSDPGEHFDLADALERADQIVTAGASLIDVGGESTRPGAEPVDPIDEQRRVLPVIEALGSGRLPAGVRISVDTRNASTAVAAVRLGASIINDVSASLWPTAADTGAAWVAVHMTGDPRTMQVNPRYGDVVGEVRRFLDGRARRAERAGVTEILVDPGIGFGKTTAHNLSLLAGTDSLVADGRPVLVGTSRKRSLGEMLARSDAAATGIAADDVTPVGVEDRLEGSLVTAVWAMIGGARIVRAHDINATVGAVQTVVRTTRIP